LCWHSHFRKNAPFYYRLLSCNYYLRLCTTSCFGFWRRRHFFHNCSSASSWRWRHRLLLCWPCPFAAFNNNFSILGIDINTCLFDAIRCHRHRRRMNQKIRYYEREKKWFLHAREAKGVRTYKTR